MRSFLFLAVFFAGCSMPSLRVVVVAETGEATTGSSNLQREGTTYGTTTTGSDLVSAIAAAPAPEPSPDPVLP